MRPNIVFIMADDLGYADLSCYGRRDFTTPNIDRIAARGVRFLQAYANSAVCSATRLALITGRYQYRLPLGLEEPLAGKTDVGLPPEHPTLPSLLKKAGYGTIADRQVAPGRSAEVRSAARAATITSAASAAAPSTTTRTQRPRQQHDLWDDDVAVHQIGYLTDLLGDRAVDAINALREIRPAVPAQPALQCAALAVGGTRRRGGVEAAAQARPCATSTAARRRPISA